MKQIVQRLPELFFIGLGIYWISENYLSSGTINWIAPIFIVLLVIQLGVQHRIAGMVLGVVLGLICSYMMFAVLSEFREYKFFDQALGLLSVGLGFFGLGVLSATAMVYKFVTSLQNSAGAEQQLTA